MKLTRQTGIRKHKKNFFTAVELSTTRSVIVLLVFLRLVTFALNLMISRGQANKLITTIYSDVLPFYKNGCEF